MQFESLKVFCDVARHRSFSLAAAANQVTQSAVSQMIAQLEKRMGLQLVDRSTRPLQLTNLGRTYYEGCKAVWDQYNELESSLRSAQARLEGTVHVAAIYSVGLGNMNQYVEAFVAARPEAEVHIEYLHPDRVYEKVLDGSVDLGLVSFPHKSAKLVIMPWRDEPMLVVCHPNHPFARQQSVPIAQLARQKYIHFSKELTIRREVERFLRAHKVSVSVLLEFDNIENIKKAIEIGAGIALLPEPTLRREVASGTLVALPPADADMARPLGIIYRRHHKLTQSAQGFLDLLCHPGAVDQGQKEDRIHTIGTDSTQPDLAPRNGAPHSNKARKKK
jgi:DNA-binding transcriptional LysR family regulator